MYGREFIFTWSVCVKLANGNDNSSFADAPEQFQLIVPDCQIDGKH
jgi:hypothetical protein